MNDVTRVVEIHNLAARKAHRAATRNDKVVQQMWHYVQALTADHVNLASKVAMLRRWYRPRRNAEHESMLTASLQWIEEAYAMTLECDPYESGV